MLTTTESKIQKKAPKEILYEKSFIIPENQKLKYIERMERKCQIRDLVQAFFIKKIT